MSGCKDDQERKPPRDLVALGLEKVGDWEAEHMAELSMVELLALTFDRGHADPAHSLLACVADELSVLKSAMESAEVSASSPLFVAVLWQIAMRAQVGAELHRRQREALLAEEGPARR